MQVLIRNILFVLIVMIFAGTFACQDDPNKLEDDAVVLEFSISVDEAKNGCQKTVKAPDGEFYYISIRAGIKDKTPLKLPPKVAARYDYPLYFRVNIKDDKNQDAVR